MKRFFKVLGLLVFLSFFLTACKKTGKPTEPDPSESSGTPTIIESEPPSTKPSTTPIPVVKYVVTFDDLLTPFDVEVEKGELVKEPTSPEEPGYNFMGWFLDDVEWDFNNPIEKDITLKGKWKLYLGRTIFFNSTHVYDGTSRSILVAGSVPPHIVISYANNE